MKMRVYLYNHAGQYHHYDAGGVLQQAKVDSLASLADQCDIAVNCAGLGAR